MPMLRRPYPRVRNGDFIAYGGNQMWAEKEVIRKCGCGPVAALDLLHYLSDADTRTPLPLPLYNHELSALCRRYYPLLWPNGINGVTLALGLNRLFRERELPYRVFWALSGKKIWARIEEMLERDLPVILSVGPNFPIVWKKNKLRLYRKLPDGSYRPAAAVRSHYVTATALDEEWLRISSWGKEYFIRRTEYEAYVRKHSIYLFSNILCIRKISA